MTQNLNLICIFVFNSKNLEPEFKLWIPSNLNKEISKGMWNNEHIHHMQTAAPAPRCLI